MVLPVPRSATTTTHTSTYANGSSCRDNVMLVKILTVRHKYQVLVVLVVAQGRPLPRLTVVAMTEVLPHVDPLLAPPPGRIHMHAERPPVGDSEALRMTGDD